jgi:hypothetical protein
LTKTFNETEHKIKEVIANCLKHTKNPSKREKVACEEPKETDEESSSSEDEETKNL